MRSRAILLIGVCASLLFSEAHAQMLSRKVNLPADSPVTLVSVDWGGTDASARGGAFFVDVHASLSLRNSSQKRVRAITFAVLSQEVTPGGKGSVSVPSLDIAPGEVFPVTIDLRLLRPIGGTAGVEVKLDGVLFDDLTFYGPDNLQSRRTMTVWELEARRDRQYFKKLLETGGAKALQAAMLDDLSRQADRSLYGMQMVRGRATNVEPQRDVSFAFLEMPDAPIQAMNGMARVSGSEAHAPSIEIRNRSERPIRYLEIGWIVKDQQGREFLAASMPADVSLAPGKTGQVGQNTALRFPERTSIQGMTGFVSTVGFADGSYWIPSRASLSDSRLRRVVTPSPEEQRLTQIYQKKGLNGLIEELKKF
jgi:hypothetical protein